MSNISCILYPPTLDYHYLVQRPQQLMKSFSELDVPVYYVNNPSPQSGVHQGIERLNENFYLFNHVDPKPFLKNLNPVIYYTSAAQTDLIRQYNPALVVFDSVDEPSEEFESWKPYYDRAVRTADIVLTTSDKLFELASSINPNSFLVPNGCDFEYFSNRIHGRPAEIANIPGPIIGYIGVVATWVDVDLIARVADKYPDFSVVVVGPLYNVTDVPRRPNIHWLGFKPYEQLAAYAQSFDVGLVPFKATSMTEAVNPIKMWEYMATGMPIVTTNMPEARKYENLMLVSETEEEFINNVWQAIFEDSVDKKSRRMILAQENSWRVRAEQIIGIIQERLALRGITESRPVPEISDSSALSYQGPSGVVVGSSAAYSYATNTMSYQGPFSYAFAPHRLLKVGRKVAFKISSSPVGRMLIQNKKLKKRAGKACIASNVSTHALVKVVGGPAFRFSTGRCVR